jgi:hypothetical protein
VALSNSLHWHSRSDIEWSIDVESEFLVETLGSNLVSLIKIDDLPSLIGIVVLVVVLLFNTNSLTFLILSISDFDNSVVSWIDESLSLVLEYLEPS